MASTLSIDARGERFLLDGKPTFLFGASYYAALGAPEAFVEADLAELKRYGVNWVRVWVTWGAFGHDVSAFDADGDERPPYWQKLLWLLELAERSGLVVDVTFSRGNGVVGAALLASDEAHLNAAGILAEGLRPLRNCYIDVANERNIADARHVPIPFVRRLRDRIKEIDPRRLVTASHAGDIEPDRLYEYLTGAKVDFLAPHRPRDPTSPAETQQKLQTLRSRMARLGKVVPIHCQEPLRRGFAAWQPGAEDLLADLKGAAAAGAAGWCFHNGHTSSAPDGRPRRSFDMRPSEGRLIDQLDDAERTFLLRAGRFLRGEPE
jgi:hypothetical protein